MYRSLHVVYTDLCHLLPVVSGVVLDLSQHMLIAVYGTRGVIQIFSQLVNLFILSPAIKQIIYNIVMVSNSVGLARGAVQVVWG